MRPGSIPQSLSANEVPLASGAGSPGTLIHLGSGACLELDYYLSVQPGSIVLVEANPFVAQELQRRCVSYPEVKVLPLAINSVPGPATLRIYNVAQFSTLSVATGLYRSFPGLRLRKEIKVKAITIEDLIGQLNLDKGQPHWLVIDTPGKESEIVSGLVRSGQLTLFTKIILHSSVDVFYEGQARMESLIDALRDEGYEVVETRAEVDADFGVCTLQRNLVLIENRALRERVDALQSQLKEKDELLAREHHALEACASRITALAQQHKEEIDRLKAALASIEGEAFRLKEAEKVATAEAQQRIADLEQQLQRVTLQQDQHLDAYRRSIGETENQLRASFGRELSNAVRQIEAFVSIQNYLSTGEGSLAQFHGWPISPDLGLFLIERIRERRHDLIIEFGSGTSTALFARAVQIARRGAGVAEALPKPICSFEHDLAYLSKTRNLVEAHGLLDQVTLAHAPLIDWQDETGNYLYYDCESALVEIARILHGSMKRLLVLVDGPPGSTSTNARYPAVPMLFKHLGRHEIDLVLDDANRREEIAVIELWRRYWNQRSVHVVDETAPSEKGLYWARNYGR